MCFLLIFFASFAASRLKNPVYREGAKNAKKIEQTILDSLLGALGGYFSLDQNIFEKMGTAV
jgi:hypothetical protein